MVTPRTLLFILRNLACLACLGLSIGIYGRWGRGYIQICSHIVRERCGGWCIKFLTPPSLYHSARVLGHRGGGVHAYISKGIGGGWVIMKFWGTGGVGYSGHWDTACPLALICLRRACHPASRQIRQWVKFVALLVLARAQKPT